MIDGTTITCGLIGNPVAHTLSPLIHNTISEVMGINQVYVPFPVAAGNLEKAIAGAYALGIRGLNVTVPYKSEVIPFLAETDPLAAAIGAVNTLVRTENGYHGYNTDMPGLYRAMQGEGIELKEQEVIILGAGGAARAVAFLCAQKGASVVYLLNRTLDRAKQIADEVNSYEKRSCVIPMEITQYHTLRNKKYLVVQATSVGLYPNSDQVIIEDPDFYRMVETGVDLIYKPSKTRFMQLVEAEGGKAVNGLRMLLYQGIIAYELWNQVSVPEELAADVFAGLQDKLASETA